jgi:hypothetical protein
LENDMSNPEQLRPSTVEGLKRLADRLQSAASMKRSHALDQAARQAGFQNFTHARRSIGEGPPAGTAPVPPRRPATSGRDAYIDEQRQGWSAKVDALTNPGGATSMTWQGIDEMVDVLRPFMGSGQNHGHFPTGGGHDFLDVRGSTTEPGCLEFQVSRKLVYLGRPSRLRLERIEAQPAESFLYIDLETIEPSGIYTEEDEEGHRRDRADEELVDIGGGNYVERDAWDRGFVDNEDDPLPDDARLVHRMLRGGLMIVCKASIWNRIPLTYNGMHNQMGADDIRRLIEAGLARRDSRADG